MSMSTKIDLFATTATSAVSQKTAAETDFHVTKCTPKPTTSSRPAVNSRCLSNRAVLIVLFVVALSAAYHKYTTYNIRVLSERLQFLEDKLALLSDYNYNHAGNDRVIVSKTGDTMSTVAAPKQSVEEGSANDAFNIDDDELTNEMPSSGDDIDYYGLEAGNVPLELSDFLLPGEDQARIKVKVRSKRSVDNVAHDRLPEDDDAAIDELPQGDDPAASTAGQRSRHLSRHSSAPGETQQHQQRHANSRTAQRQKLQPSNAIKVAQFVAPRREGHFTSDDSLPPVTYRFWQPDNLTLAQRPQFFRHDNETGLVTILEPGVYLLYAQIVYHDMTGRWAFGVYVDDTERFKCMNTEQLQHHRQTQFPRRDADISGQTGSRTASSHSVYQSCYTSGLLRLKMYDKLSLRCLYGGKSVVMQPGFTFWGLVKLISL